MNPVDPSSYFNNNPIDDTIGDQSQEEVHDQKEEHVKKETSITSIFIEIINKKPTNDEENFGDLSKSENNEMKEIEVQQIILDEDKEDAVKTKHKSIETKHKSIETKHKSIETKHKSIETKHKSIETKHKQSRKLSESSEQDKILKEILKSYADTFLENGTSVFDYALDYLKKRPPTEENKPEKITRKLLDHLKKLKIFKKNENGEFVLLSQDEKNNLSKQLEKDLFNYFQEVYPSLINQKEKVVKEEEKTSTKPESAKLETKDRDKTSRRPTITMPNFEKGQIGFLVCRNLNSLWNKKIQQIRINTEIIAEKQKQIDNDLKDIENKRWIEKFRIYKDKMKDEDIKKENDEDNWKFRIYV